MPVGLTAVQCQVLKYRAVNKGARGRLPGCLASRLELPTRSLMQRRGKKEVQLHLQVRTGWGPPKQNTEHGSVCRQQSQEVI